MTTNILWLRQDLRLHDQPALVAAAGSGAVLPVYVLDDETPGRWRMGGAQRWWLHHSLKALAKALDARGSRLVLRRGPAVAILEELLTATGADRVHAVRHSEPWWAKAEAALGDRLCLHEGNQLAPLETVRTGAGTPFKVYSAFWRALEVRMPPPAPLAAPDRLPAPPAWPATDSLADWQLLPLQSDWAAGFADAWMAGETEALAKAEAFADIVNSYGAHRDLPGEEGTSRLSPHLHFGEISPRTLWHATGRSEGAAKFRKELAWRDFAANLTLAMPDYGERNGRPAFDRLRRRSGDEVRGELRAWQRGRTGYPIVDAGMRQLWKSGWMHNRVRMIAASFLVKHLLIDWREGERWFWDTLVDADYGNNAVNWQWIAGSGVDSNMFGRIMAPLSQSEKFDAGDYIRRWVPELAHLPEAAIHDPEVAGMLPRGYPAKIIGHRAARERALEAGRAVR